MGNTSKITVEKLKKYDSLLVEKRLGNLTDLDTTEKGTLVGAINEANGAAIAAHTTANQGVTDAAAAKSAADAAQSTANEAKSAAATAQTQADKGVSDAATANTAAGNAQTTADEAKSAAATAQTTANAAHDKIGDTELSTTADTLTAAINEVFAAVGTGGTAAVVGVKESSSTDYAKVYTITQGGTTVGTINIPKDMVVSSGSVVELSASEATAAGLSSGAGTYIKLVLANSSAPLYINAADLVDVYTAASGATQVQLTVTGTTISAALVAGGVGTTELADGAVTRDKISASAVNAAKLANDSVTTDKIANSAVTTTKIGDKNVTKAKLEDSVQTSLGKADTAVQPADITGIATNTTNITNLTTRVETLETDIATDEEIDAIFE